MARLLHRILPPAARKTNTFFLAFFWCAGLLLGIVLFYCASEPAVSLMRMAAFSRVSIVSLLTSLLLPFLFSAFAVFTHNPLLLFFVCLLKASLFSFVSVTAFSAFGNAGWLIRFLLMFSDLMSLVPLYWCCRRYLTGGRFSFDSLIGCAGYLFMCFSLDYCFVSPLLLRLENI